MKALSASLLLCAVASYAAYSQRITGWLGGTVLDPSGAAVPEAAVRATNIGTQNVFQQKTGLGGRFLLPSLPPGQYSVTVEAVGFKKLERSGITLQVDQTADLELSLEIGSVTESVRVTSDAPMLQTETGEMGQVVTARSIENLPLNQRNTFSLILLSPGVAGSVRNDFKRLQFNVNGGRSGTTDVLLDGVPSAPPTDDFKALTVFPSLDAVQEFKVQTSSYSAEFGLSGGGIINVIFKSGSNDVHGTA